MSNMARIHEIFEDVSPLENMTFFEDVFPLVNLMIFQPAILVYQRTTSN